MTSETFSLMLKIASDTAGIRSATEQVSGFRKALSTVSVGLAGLGIPTSFGATIVAIKGAASSALQFADELKGTAENLGISTDALQILRVVARESGGDIGKLENSLNKMRMALQDGWENAGRNRDAFQKLGLSMALVKNMSPEQQFVEIAKAISGASDQQEAFSAASVILGEKNLPKLRSVLSELASSGYDKLAASVKDANQIISASDIARLDASGDAIQRLYGRMKSVVASQLAEAAGFYGIGDKEMIGVGPNKLPTVNNFELDKKRQENLTEEAKAKFLLINAEQRLALITQDSAQTELQKREAIVETLLDQAKALETIRSARYRDVIGIGKDRSHAPTDEELKRLQEANRLENEANGLRERASLLKTGGPSAFTKVSEQYAGINNPSVNSGYMTASQGADAGVMNVITNIGSVGQQMERLVSGNLLNGINSVTDGITGWVTGAQSFNDALANIRTMIAVEMVRSIVAMGVQWAMTHIIMKGVSIAWHALLSALGWKQVVEVNAQETAKKPALATSAGLASAGSFGVSAMVGLAALIALMAVVSSFDVGGYTGAGPRMQPAGVVHAGEWVAPQWMVNDPRSGAAISMLENMRVNRSAGSSFDSSSISAPVSVGTSGRSSPVINLAIHGTERDAQAWLRTTEGEKYIIDTVRRNGGLFS